MYIPMCESEEIRCKMPEPFGTELIVKPFTGENETYYFDQMEAGTKLENAPTVERLKPLKNIFNKFVVGYIKHDGSEFRFGSANAEPSKYFGQAFVNAFVSIDVITKINYLSVEEKKT